MKERPILFSAPMVRSILADRKSQTRRVLKTQPIDVLPITHGQYQGKWIGQLTNEPSTGVMFHCKHGEPGDRLWVRESVWERPTRSDRDMREGADTWPPYIYDADLPGCWDKDDLKRLNWKRRSSIHMPRRASRITLEITEVRVERLMDITDSGARREGIYQIGDFKGDPLWWYTEESVPNCGMQSPSAAFINLWGSINGSESVRANPWVWVLTFKRLQANQVRDAA